MNRLIQLEYQYRLEEVCERYGFALEIHEDGGRLRFEQFARVRINGRYLTPNRMRTLAFVSGLMCDDEGIWLDWNQSLRSPEALENGLLMLFGVLSAQHPEAFLQKPRPGIQIPASGELPTSARFLERFYGDGFFAREKKPAVVDLAKSHGAYLRSVDDDALQIVDAASQIASLAAGFRPDEVQCALDDGAFDPYLTAAPTAESAAARPAFEPLREALLEVAPPGLHHVAFANGGAEANEKALHIARIHGPGGRRVLAFTGSFHGRTLLSLYSTYNPVKREPYQIPGFETSFLPIPWLEDPYADPVVPPGWRAAWADPDGPREALKTGEPLLGCEVDTLCEVEASIRQGDVLACIVEPYQCEGGDKTASRRWFHGLRALTRAYGVPLVFDEVQSGFGLSGKPFWHNHFRLLDAEGNPDGPDLVVGAKRAQVGYVISRWPDPAPTPAHAASAVRGRKHLELVLRRPGHEARARLRLRELVEKWGHVVSKPRAFGDAFAFDMPSKAAANHLIGQRFYRGYMVYIAGERTLRYRLNRGMRPDDVDRVFGVVDASIQALVAQAGGEGPDLHERLAQAKPPAWVAPPAPREHPLPTVAELLAAEGSALADRVLRELGELNDEDRETGARILGLKPDEARGDAVRAAAAAADPADFEARMRLPLVRWVADALGTRVRRLKAGEFQAFMGAIEALQIASYEPARRDSLAYLGTLLDVQGGLCLVAEDPAGLVGIAAGGPLELWPDVDGPRQDPHRGRNDSFYSADITVAPRGRGHGLGVRLRAELIKAALQLRGAKGRARYAFVTGRNRVGAADAMWAINQRFGAYVVAEFSGQYGSPDGRTRYYRIPLRRGDRRAFAAPAPRPTRIELGQGLSMPTGMAHPLLVRARDLGVFDEGALTKLTVSNFITRPYARYSEYLQHVAPQGNKHLYFTSCNDEMVDKSLRVLKHKRTEGRLAIGLQGGYQGNTTAAARSLSEPGGDSPRHGFFGWPLVPHPSRDLSACVAALDAIVAEHGADAVIGVYVEAVQQRTGEVMTPQAWQGLCAWRDRTGVPLVLNENATALYRSARRRFWWVDSVAGDADLVLWWGGGQIGHIFASDAAYVSKPLSFISTWDGDELSATRLLWQMFACGYAHTVDRAAQLDSALRAAGFSGETVAGLGLYRVLRLGAQRAAAIQGHLAARGIDVARPADDVLVIAPAVTVDEGAVEALAHGLKDAVGAGL